ncbi:MAG: copper resistance protein B [Pseudomonadales bacterium]
MTIALIKTGSINLECIKTDCISIQSIKKIFLLVPMLSVLVSSAIAAESKDDPILTKVIVDQFERRDADDDNPLVLDGQGWIGKDLRKLWFKTQLERVDGENEKAELQALYSRGVTTFWDFQLGLRKDFETGANEKPDRSWAVIGFQGLAPYFFEIDTALFIGESGRLALRMEAEYEWLFTQRLILTPDIEVNVYGQHDEATGAGSGLSDIELGLRLRYEIRREFAPYIGVNWMKAYGNSADFARRENEDTRDAQLVIGVRAWF